jgi:hypothetical protein
MDHEIMPSRHLLVLVVILAWGPVSDRLSRDGPSRSWVPASTSRGRVAVDIVSRQPISPIETAVSLALRGGIPR